MQVVALHSVSYDMIERREGERFEMQDDHVFPFEQFGHVKRVDVTADEVPETKGRKRAKE